MYGGLKKSASRLALVAAAGVLSTTAYAADLGGDCCADLEERVAELEATTARKGTRKTSLEVWGVVNQAITGWSDGSRWNATLGYGNHNLQTRFGFRGSAKISPSTSAGYSIVVDVADKARTSTFGQTQDIGGSKMAGGGATRAGDDYTIRMRDANWWLESSVLGRVTVGRITSELAVGSPDIAGILHAVGDDVGCNGGGLQFRDAVTGVLSGRAIGSYSANCGGPWANRLQGLKYQSPTLAGFQFIATYGGNLKNEGTNIDSTARNAAEAGNEYGVGLRYAGEFSGIRIAANAGVQYDKNNRDLAVGYSNGDALASSAFSFGTYTSSDTRLIDVGLGLMHVPTGIFASGNYAVLNINQQDPSKAAVATYTAGAREAKRWNVRAGIGQNWFGIGKTTFYGEYIKMENFRYAYNVYTPCADATCSTTVVAGTPAGDSMRTWGLGFNQAIDAAAMDLYFNYRNYKATDVSVANGLKDVSVITTGARIRF
jgi:Gram-negative porin